MWLLSFVNRNGSWATENDFNIQCWKHMGCCLMFGMLKSWAATLFPTFTKLFDENKRSPNSSHVENGKNNHHIRGNNHTQLRNNPLVNMSGLMTRNRTRMMINALNTFILNVVAKQMKNPIWRDWVRS